MLGAGAGDTGVDITRATGGDEEGSPGGGSSKEMVLGAGAGAEWSGVPPVGVAGSLGKSERQCDCSVISEADGVGFSGSDWAKGGVRRGGET